MARLRSILVVALALGATFCAAACRERSSSRAGDASAKSDDAYAGRRAEMVETQLKSRDIVDPRVLEVMGKVPRHRFVPALEESHAYEDRPLSIAQGQTISQPYIVALMTQLAGVKPGDRVLDIGTGSGYQAAVLAEIGAEVASIEIVPELAEQAAKRLKELKYDNVTVRVGDGYRGWPDRAPFKAIILAAAAPKIPEPLIEQLAPGGKLVVPVGPEGGLQQLLVITKNADGTTRRETIAPVAFVPMTGEIRK